MFFILLSFLGIYLAVKFIVAVLAVLMKKDII